MTLMVKGSFCKPFVMYTGTTGCVYLRVSRSLLTLDWTSVSPCVLGLFYYFGYLLLFWMLYYSFGSLTALPLLGLLSTLLVTWLPCPFTTLFVFYLDILDVLCHTPAHLLQGWVARPCTDELE